MPIDWNFALRELRGEMKPSYTNGDCALGVNNGGKHSVDVTYIAAGRGDRARCTVATAAPRHRRRARRRDGRWEVHVDRIDTAGRVLEQKILTTKALVMAAGSANTTQAPDARRGATATSPTCPTALGDDWGSNADRIYAVDQPRGRLRLAAGRPGRLRQQGVGRPGAPRTRHPGLAAADRR